MTEHSVEDLELIDAYVAGTSPAVMVPRAKALPPLQAVGERYLVANDGVYVEFRRAWCRGIKHIAPSSIELPFGRVVEHVKMLCSKPPASLYRRFVDISRAAMPNEVAAWFVWNENKVGDDAWRMVQVEAISSSAVHIQFHRPVLEQGEHMVVDIHSHGAGRAGFSSVDNVSDSELRDIKIAAVIGGVHQHNLSTAQRFCVLGTAFREGECNEIRSAGL